MQVSSGGELGKERENKDEFSFLSFKLTTNFKKQKKRQSYFSDPRFPENMPEIWEKQWAFAKTKASPPSEENEAAPAIVIGEFGGKFSGGLERCWVVSFADFLRKAALTDTFFWCLNPNSGDTGGLLKDDWSGTTDLEEFKLSLLRLLNPNPTKFDARGNVVSPGGGKGYDPVATPLPGEILDEIEAGKNQGGGGGGGAAVASAGGAGGGRRSLPAPVTTAHPELGIAVTVAATKSWPSGPRTALQCDVKIKNDSSNPVPASFTFRCDAGIVEQSWNCTRLGDSGTEAVFGLPDWALANGGIPPGGELTAGGVFFDSLPSFDVALS